MSEAGHPVPTDVINFAVTLIRMRSHGEAPNQCEVGSATGFFFQTGSRKYLVTNRHVVIDEGKSFYPDNLLIRVHTSSTSNILNRDITIPLYGPDHQAEWLEHENHEIDIVAIPIDDFIQSTDVVHYFTPSDLPPSNLIIGVQENCMVIGYPLGFYDSVHNLPITRFATMASVYGAHFGGKRFFLVDATLHPGTSGSPVILPPQLARRTIDGTGSVTTSIGGPMSYCLLGVNSGMYMEALNCVWYSDLIPEIIPST
jgi:hypothetical protein